MGSTAMDANGSTTRFSTRVADYIKYRPSYPPELLRVMAERCGFNAGSVVADLGSGTGILGGLLLRNGNPVFGVEPNAAMREAGEALLARYAGFRSVAGTAERTTLASGSIDVVTAGQAFHWFDRAAAKQEFARILKPLGWVVLVWNDPRIDASPFQHDYEELLRRFGTDYLAVQHQDFDLAQFREFTGSASAGLDVLEFAQPMDFEALRGRLLSSSFAPEQGHPAHEPMLARLGEIFDRWQMDGKVAFSYETKIYHSQLG